METEPLGPQPGHRTHQPYRHGPRPPERICPHCEAPVRADTPEEPADACPFCGKRLHGSAARTAPPEPLYLPRGSVRGASTLLLFLSAWIVLLAGRDAPGYVLDLLLAIVGYYFALRHAISRRQSPDRTAAKPTEPAQPPLFLPGHTVRILLVLLLGLSTATLIAQGRLGEPAYLEFFLILTGLVAGYLYARVTAGMRKEGILVLLGHLKAVLVLGASVLLSILLLTGLTAEQFHLSLALACVVSFYFGSRS
jgi:hypothetical protein